MKYEQDLNAQLEENENLNTKFLENKMDKDKYKGELEIALEEKKSLKNQLEEQTFKFNDMLKERDEYYMKQINSLNQRLRLNMAKNEENNELNDENNYFNNNVMNEKLAKNGEEIYGELLRLKKENIELKKENEKLKEENEKLKFGKNEINNNINKNESNDNYEDFE